MVRPIKHSDRKKKRYRTTRELGRKGPTRNPRCRILIVCEGSKTEPGYFEGLKKKYRPCTSAVEIVGEECGSDPKSVVNCAIKKKYEPHTEYDHVWCVIDVEGYDNPRDLTGPLRTASDNNINVALSNPCFEVWLLYHFERVGSAFDDCGDVIHELKNHISNYTKGGNYFNEYFSDTINTAIENAELIMKTQWQKEYDPLLKNPSTEVHQLVQLIQENANSR